MREFCPHWVLIFEKTAWRLTRADGREEISTVNENERLRFRLRCLGRHFTVRLSHGPVFRGGLFVDAYQTLTVVN